MRVAWHTHPFVSGLLVLSEHSRAGMALETAASFLAQTWPVKELVVINGTGRTLGISEAREFLFTTCPWNETELLNMALHAARGEWCAPLADDAWYAPHYLDEQMRQADPTTVSVTVDTSVHYLPTGHQEHVRRWELASVVFHRRACHNFEHPFSIQAFLRSFPRQRLLEFTSPLVTRFFHDASSVDSPAVRTDLPAAAPAP